MNLELSGVQAELEKAEKPEICWIIEKARELKKISISVSLTMLKPLTMWIVTNCGKLLKRWESRPSYLSPEKSVCMTRSNS